MSLIINCPICVEQIENPIKNCCTTPCGHTFHSSCLFKHFTYKNTCPICRHELLDLIIESNDDSDEDNDDDDSDEENDDDDNDDDDNVDDDNDDNSVHSETIHNDILDFKPYYIHDERFTQKQIYDVLIKHNFGEQDFLNIILLTANVLLIKSTENDEIKYDKFFKILTDIYTNKISVD